MFKVKSILYATSIQRLVITSFIFVLLFPIGFFIYSLFQNSWQKAEQNILERNQLISATLTEPFTLYITSKQVTMTMMARELEEAKNTHTFSLNNELPLKNSVKNTSEILKKYQQASDNVVAVTYIEGTKHNLAQAVSTHQQVTQAYLKTDYQNANFVAIKTSNGSPSSVDALSPVFRSKLSGGPVVLLRHKILGANQQVTATLYTEIALSGITSMCSKIVFGQQGHCAVVDHLGQVIAHSNTTWVDEIKNLSKASVVQDMISGKSGIKEFSSPFSQEIMVAGFSAIPRLGWGVMIPQPKSELISGFAQIRESVLLWLLFGVLSAAIIAWKLAEEITRPIKLLMQKTSHISRTHYVANFDSIPDNSPNEIKQLWQEFSKLVSGLRKSHDEVERLNQSLNEDIEKATQELRETNQKLYQLSTQDYLTSLPNRRFFTNFLNKKLGSSLVQNIGVIFVDVDYFKTTNDSYGHEVGDEMLIHLSKLLKGAIRPCDIAARLGGDEFVVYVDNCNRFLLSMIAEKIRRSAEDNPLLIDNQTVKLSLSLGTVSHLSDNSITAREFFRLADQAMYTSKRKGRNAITHYETNHLKMPNSLAG